MNSIGILLAGLALVLPTGVSSGSPPQDVRHAGAERTSRAPMSLSATSQPFTSLLQQHQPDRQNQVRIEQRVIVRIAPARSTRQDLVADLAPKGQAAKRYREQPMRRCVAVGNIAGVQSGPDNRLILFMRDRLMVTAALEKACNARDFYSGFYIERSDDGLLCSGRDTLQSRTGASCGLQKLAHLVAVKD
jgi:hypothetical protein